MGSQFDRSNGTRQVAWDRMAIFIVLAILLVNQLEVLPIRTSSASFATVDPQWITLFSAVTTGTSREIESGGATQIGFECESSAGVSAGIVVIEHSAVEGYAGTWAALDTKDFSALGASKKTFFTYPGPLGRIRARVTTNFVGGTLTVREKRMFGM